MANSKSFWVPMIFPIAQENKYLGKFSYFINLSCKCLLSALIKIASSSTRNIPLWYIKKTSLNYPHLPLELTVWLNLSGSNYQLFRTNFHSPKKVLSHCSSTVYLRTVLIKSYRLFPPLQGLMSSQVVFGVSNITLRSNSFIAFANRYTASKTSAHLYWKIWNRNKLAASEEKAVIKYANSKGSGEPSHTRSLARNCAVRSRKRKVKEKLQPKNYTCGLANGSGMYIERFSRNAAEILFF